MSQPSPNNSLNGKSFENGSLERKYNQVDMAEIQNYAFKKINI